MSESSYFSKLMSRSQNTEEERQTAAVLYNDYDVVMGDKRLNQIAALTYNIQSCQRIFAMLEKAIAPSENPWKVIFKALLILHSIILYGSELSIDKCIDMCKWISPLQEYNSALVKKGFFGGGGTDYGAPVRAEAKTVVNILLKDENIRKARADARNAGGNASLVPMGEDFLGLNEQYNPSKGISGMTYGQTVTSSVGAGFGMEAVPGMYEGRPDRYFDDANDRRKQSTTVKDHQITRDKQAPSLLDLAFDDPLPSTASSNLPPADYLPALQKQQELERQLAEQQELLRKLQAQQAAQTQTQAQQLTMPQSQQPQKSNFSDDLLGLYNTPAAAAPPVNSGNPYNGALGQMPGSYPNQISMANGGIGSMLAGQPSMAPSYGMGMQGMVGGHSMMQPASMGMGPMGGPGGHSGTSPFQQYQVANSMPMMQTGMSGMGVMQPNLHGTMGPMGAFGGMPNNMTGPGMYSSQQQLPPSSVGMQSYQQQSSGPYNAYYPMPNNVNAASNPNQTLMIPISAGGAGSTGPGGMGYPSGPANSMGINENSVIENFHRQYSSHKLTGSPITALSETNTMNGGPAPLVWSYDETEFLANHMNRRQQQGGLSLPTSTGSGMNNGHPNNNTISFPSGPPPPVPPPLPAIPPPDF